MDESGKAVRIHKVITTTTTITCFGGIGKPSEGHVRTSDVSSISDESLPSNGERTAEEKFVDHVKELSVDTKDVLLHTAAGVQHAFESAGDFIRTQLATTPSSEHVDRLPGKEPNDLLHQAVLFKDVIVQKAMDVKDATVDVIKELTTPTEQPTTVSFHHGTTTMTAMDKKHE